MDNENKEKLYLSARLRAGPRGFELSIQRFKATALLIFGVILACQREIKAFRAF